MKTLISSNIINKFKTTIPEDEYLEKYGILKTYQSSKNQILKMKETEFQSEFLSSIFGDILGYIPRNKSISNPNLIVEKKIEAGQKYIDGAIIDKNGRSRIVIELKSTHHKDLLVQKNSKGGSGLHGLAPIQQASIYLFSEPLAELAVVSNFDSLIIFDKKEYFRQEFSLFEMNYDEFKEFYLILSSNSFWSGLTKLMIDQTSESDKKIDDDFFIKTTALYKMLINQMDEKYAKDLFNKFLALAILEDNGSLPTNLINSVYDKKMDFTTKGSFWDLWSNFLRAMKNDTVWQKSIGIDEQIIKMDVWQDVSYFGKVKVSKATLDLLLEISKYDLWSIPLDRLFFEISKDIFNPYNMVGGDNSFDIYKEIMKDNNNVAGFQTLSFVCKRTISTDFSLIELFNEISSEKIDVIDSYNSKIIMDCITTLPDYFLIVELDMLEDKDFLDEIKRGVFTITITEEYDEILAFIQMSINSDSNIGIRNVGSDGNITYEYEIKREELNKFKVMSIDDKKWLENYNETTTYKLKNLLDITSEDRATIRFNFDTQIVTLFDTELELWEQSLDDFIDSDNYIYFTPKVDYAHLILKSSDFKKYLNLTYVDKTNILDILISEKLISSEFLECAMKQEELRKRIDLFELKLDKLKQNGDELKIIECEAQLDRLYELEKEYRE